MFKLGRKIDKAEAELSANDIAESLKQITEALKTLDCRLSMLEARVVDLDGFERYV